jgi:hypothetical protein
VTSKSRHNIGTTSLLLGRIGPLSESMALTLGTIILTALLLRGAFVRVHGLGVDMQRDPAVIALVWPWRQLPRSKV